MSEVQKTSTPVGQNQGSQPQVSVSGSLTEPQLPKDIDADELTTYFRMRNRYVLIQGVLGAPICAVPGSQTESMAFATVHLPTAALAVDWQSWRKGERAQKPRPYLGDNNTVLIKNEIDMDNMEIEGDDKNYFICSGTYIYGFKDRSKMTLSHPLPTYIVIPDKAAIVASDSDFVPNILNAGWPNNKANNAITKNFQ